MKNVYLLLILSGLAVVMNNHLYGSKNSEFMQIKQVENDLSLGWNLKMLEDTSIIINNNYVQIDSIDEARLEEYFSLEGQDDWIDFDWPEPQFPGGDIGLIEFVNGEINLEYPDSLELPKGRSIVFVRFVIDEIGAVSDVRIVRGEHKVLNDEALRVVKAMPKWYPVEANGKKYKVTYTLPISFYLN